MAAALMHDPAVFAVIPSFNQTDQTLRCLRSLASGDVAPTPVVVDHGSDEETVVAIQRDFQEAVVLRGDDTVWWAGATNIGVRYALAHGADYVLTFNCDGVVDRATVGALLEFERGAGRVLVGALQKFLHEPERTYNAGVRFGGTRGTWFWIPKIGDEPWLRIDAIGANCLLIPRGCFDEVGLFDERRLPQTWSDFDFQLRARSAGWSVYCVAAGAVWVDLSTTAPGLTRDTGLRRAAMLLTDWRSPYNVVHFPRFLLRHAPRRFVLVMAVRAYRPLALTVMRHYGRPFKRALARVGATRLRRGART